MLLNVTDLCFLCNRNFLSLSPNHSQTAMAHTFWTAEFEEEHVGIHANYLQNTGAEWNPKADKGNLSKEKVFRSLYFNLLGRWVLSLWWFFHLVLIKQSKQSELPGNPQKNMFYVNLAGFCVHETSGNKYRTYKIHSATLPLCPLEFRHFNHFCLSAGTIWQPMKWMRPDAITNWEGEPNKAWYLLWAVCTVGKSTEPRCFVVVVFHFVF